MKSFNLNNFTADLVEKTIHYIRYNITKDKEPFNETITITNYKDICTYNEIIKNLYSSSVELLSYDNSPKEGDKVIITSHFFLGNLHTGYLVNFDLIKNVALVSFKPIKDSTFDDHMIYTLKEIVFANQTDKINALKSEREKYVNDRVKTIEKSISSIEEKISLVKKTMSIVKTEVHNLEVKISANPSDVTDGKKKSFRQKSKCLGRKERQFYGYEEGLNTLKEDKEGIIKDEKFNKCIAFAISEIE